LAFGLATGDSEDLVSVMDKVPVPAFLPEDGTQLL